MFQLTEGYDLNQNSREGASLESPPYYHPALRLCSRALGETEVVFSTRGAYFNWQETPSTRKKEEAKKAMAGNNSISGAWVLDLNRLVGICSNKGILPRACRIVLKRGTPSVVSIRPLGQSYGGRRQGAVKFLS